MIHHFRSSDLFISSSVIEPFGITSLEALGCGIPILVSQNNGIRDILDETLHGKVFGDTATELATAIEHMMENRQFYKVNSKNIVSSIEPYDWSAIAKKYIPYLTQLI